MIFITFAVQFSICSYYKVVLEDTFGKLRMTKRWLGRQGKESLTPKKN